MHLTYLGQCGFLFETAGVRIVTDPYLSDSIATWQRQYPVPCTLADLKPDAVLISHAHCDHLDPQTLRPYRDQGGDCIIAAPAPECAPLYEMGFSRVIPARAEQAFSIGDVRITPIMCAHTEPHADDQGRFRELSYFIESPEGKWFFGGDLSLYDGLRERLCREKPALVILPCNGRDERRTAANIIGNTTAEEAARLARDCGAVLIPAHFDLYAENGCSLSHIEEMAEAAGAQLLRIAPGCRAAF